MLTKQTRQLLILIWVLSLGTTFAHQDFYRTEDFGNVKVRIKTGFHYEEIYKVFIFGKLTQKLARQVGYTDQIFLDFNHFYVEDCQPDHFISFDRGKINNIWEGADKRKAPLEKKAVVIRQVARQFDAETTLKLVEYAIQHILEIQNHQKFIAYNENHCQWRIQTIDTSSIKEVLKQAPSQALIQVISSKIERPLKNFRFEISYFWKDNRYTIFIRNSKQETIEIKTLDNMYVFKNFSNSRAMVFDTDSSFFFISLHNGTPISGRQVIEDTHENFRPFRIKDIGQDKFTLYFSYYPQEGGFQPKQRTYLYDAEKDTLIQYLDKKNEKE